MVIDSDVTLQTCKNLRQKTWLFEPDDQKVIDSLKRVADCAETYFRETRNMLLEDSISFLEKKMKQAQMIFKVMWSIILFNTRKAVRMKRSATTAGQQMIPYIAFEGTIREALENENSPSIPPMQI